MLSGTSPFKDASEWLIFQRIIARDIRFPNYFSEEAKDLIDRLLVSYQLMLLASISNPAMDLRPFFNTYVLCMKYLLFS